jgi:hypothetical protein
MVSGNSFCSFCTRPYPVDVIDGVELRSISEVRSGSGCCRCTFTDGTAIEIPAFLGRFLRTHDQLVPLSPANTEVLIRRQPPRARPQQFLFATIGHVIRPKASETGGFYVRAKLPNCSGKPKSLFLPASALRRYFYLLGGDDRGPSLYALLGAAETSSPGDLRLAWRFRSLEFDEAGSQARNRAQIERAFNVLANPELRNCYDAMRKDEDAPALFPYGGFGSIFVEGHLSEEGEAFFADRIIGVYNRLMF